MLKNAKFFLKLLNFLFINSLENDDVQQSPYEDDEDNDNDNKCSNRKYHSINNDDEYAYVPQRREHRSCKRSTIRKVKLHKSTVKHLKRISFNRLMNCL